MADLIAQGSEPQHRWRRALRANQRFTLGRDAGIYSTPWDQQISRRHISACFHDGRLRVEKLADAKNPVFLEGQPSDAFTIGPGEHFVIGQTTFSLAGDAVKWLAEADRPVEEQTYSSQALERVRFHNADQRIEVLSRLPEVISGAVNETELFVRLVNMLLAGIPRASAVALVAADEHAPPGAPVRVLHWDRRLSNDDDFRPSQRLILDAVRRGESVLHIWEAKADAAAQFTVSANVDWAFCTPVPGDVCRGWGVYVAGQFAASLLGDRPAAPEELREDLKFTELVAATLNSLRHTEMLQRRQAALRGFFSPQILEAITHEDPDVVLAPRETEVSVLFCDVRGFSRRAEKQAGDLLALLDRVSKALGVMTHHILDKDGVFGDFQGDAAMGFWGWPIAQVSTVENACSAALAIRLAFETAARQPDHPLADFRVGIGLATGRAVAGRIGTVDQSKVTVFGPVVNLASRLEGMTKILQSPILLDEPTARAVREQMPRDVARSRRIAVVRPYGFDETVEVSELLPPEADYPDLSDENIRDYEAALAAFIAGDWSNAVELLHRVPAKDRVKDFLTVYIAQYNRTPPPGWDGVVTLQRKG